MSYLFPFVLQETTITGTGNLTITTVTGYRSFSDAAGTGATNKFYYAIRHITADEWEEGVGYMSDATTLVREVVINSSNSDAAVNFSAGTKEIVCDVNASQQIATTINHVETTYTFTHGDNNKRHVFTNASAIAVTVPNDLLVDWNAEAAQGGAGTVTFSPEAGATLNNRQSHTDLAGQHARAHLSVLANSDGSSAEINLAGDTA